MSLRARNIKPGFFRNEALAELPIGARLLFAGIWLVADREGRLEDRPKRIAAELFPYDRDIDVDAGLAALERKSFISRYQVKGMRLIQVLNFKKHQSPHHTERASILPGPPSAPGNLALTSPVIHGEPTKESRLSNGEHPPDSPIHRLSDSLKADSPKQTSLSDKEEGAAVNVSRLQSAVAGDQAIL